MEIVGGILSDEETLTAALQALEEVGLKTHLVYGLDDFSGEPGANNGEEAPENTQQHTAAGTVSGISVNPPSDIPDDASTETIKDELMAVGLPATDAEMFVSGLQADQLLLLVQTWTGETQKAEEIMKAHDAKMLRRIHPDDAFPEDLWRQP